MWHDLDAVLSDDFGNGGIGERVAPGRGKDEGTAATGLLGIVQERQGPDGQRPPMLFARFRSGGWNDLCPSVQVDFIPRHQTGLTASGSR